MGTNRDKRETAPCKVKLLLEAKFEQKKVFDLLQFHLDQ